MYSCGHKIVNILLLKARTQFSSILFCFYLQIFKTAVQIKVPMSLSSRAYCTDWEPRSVSNSDCPHNRAANMLNKIFEKQCFIHSQEQH